MSMKKRIFSLFSSLIILFMAIGNLVYVDAKETNQEPVYLIACSDYQDPDGNDVNAVTVNNILAQMKTSGYEEVDGFICAGDYDHEYTESAEGIASLKSTVLNQYSTIPEANMVFVQGNHDSAGTAGLSTSGAHDTQDYGVFVINEDDYMDDNGNETIIKNTAKSLDIYLESKVSENNEKPIFVVSHLPLHYSDRTYKGGCAMYAKYLFDVLNEYAKTGQNIIFLYGHNHNSFGYDDYMGGAASYMTTGDNLYIAQPGEPTEKPVSYELNFTYMNAGYIGYYYGTKADTALTMTVFEINDDYVKVERYSADGIHNMKSAGGWNSDKEKIGADDSYLSSVYGSPQAIVPTATKQVVVSEGEKTAYRLASDFTNGKNYIIATKNGTGSAYALKNNSDGTIAASNVMINVASNAACIDTSDQSLIWNYIKDPNAEYDSGLGDLKNLSTNRYLTVQNGNELITTDDKEQEYTFWRPSGSGGVYTMNNMSSLKRSYILYSDGFYAGAKNASQQVYVYEECVIPDGVITAALDNKEGTVELNADDSTLIGSKIVVFYPDATVQTIDITLGMLRDASGKVINTEKVAVYENLHIYYNDVLICDEYSLAVDSTTNLLDIAVYKETGTYPERRGYVFSGWYADDAFTRPLGVETGDGNAYAKFVDQDVLGLYFQVTADKTTVCDETDLRVLTSVDSKKYQNVGFKFEVNGIKQIFTTRKVYAEVYGYTSDGTKITYGPDAFSEESQYIMAFNLSKIPYSAFSTEIKITPLWTTMDGTVVSGASRLLRLDENLKIRDLTDGISFDNDSEMKYFAGRTDATVANGTLSRVTYAEEGFTSYDNSCGEYLLKLEGDTLEARRPQLEIHPGRTLSAGTKVTFMIRVENDGLTSASLLNFRLYEKTSSGSYAEKSKASQKATGEWHKITFTLKTDTDAFRLTMHFENKDDDSLFSNAITRVYYDNIKIHSITDGVTFEDEIEIAHFTTRDHAEVGGAVTRVKYTDVGITAMDDSCDDYALQLKGTTDNQYRPQLVVNLGKTVPVGTRVKFKILIDSDVVISGDNKLIVQVKSNTKNAWDSSDGVKIPYNAGNTILSTAKTWEEVEFTTTAESSYLLIVPYCVDNSPYKTAHQDGTYNAVYIDNFVVTEPKDITDGLAFEDEIDMSYVAGRQDAAVAKGTATRVTYAEEGITAYDDNCGQYLMKLKGDTESAVRPQLVIDFGKTLPAGTKISFKMRVDNPTLTENFAIQVKSNTTNNWGGSGGSKFVFNGNGNHDYVAGTWHNVVCTTSADSNYLLVLFFTSDASVLTNAQTNGNYNVMYIDNVEIKTP